VGDTYYGTQRRKKEEGRRKKGEGRREKEVLVAGTQPQT
jgi:hypothetical protein